MKTNEFKKKVQPDTLSRIDLKLGSFATISNKAMMDKNLTSDGFRILTIMLNKSSDWDINLGYFSRELIWDPKKMTSAIHNLQVNGYLTKTKKSFGKGKFEWIYQIYETPIKPSETALVQPKQESKVEVPVK